MHISGAKFAEHSSNISKDILDWVFYDFRGTIDDVIVVSFAYYKNVNISKTKYVIEKNAILV